MISHMIEIREGARVHSKSTIRYEMLKQTPQGRALNYFFIL